MVIAVFLVIWGESTRESVFSIIGWIFLFFLSITILYGGGVTYVSGANTSISYTYNGTSISSSAITSSDVLTSFDDSNSKWFGRYLAIISIIGFVLGLVSVRRGWKEDD